MKKNSSNRGHKLTILHAGAAALALVYSGAAWAQGAPPADVAADAADADADAIVVTARHREENSQDIPVALSVVSAETLERTGNYTLSQVQQLVPSLQVFSFNPRNTNVNIRGLGSNVAITVDGLEYGVGFYVDGVYYARPGQSQFDLIDLQQVEVLHGPQGTLFGKNTTAGAINITTRLPSFTPELTVEASGGNYGYHQVRASASAPIIEDKLALRISVGDTHRDGFLTNIHDGSDAQNYDNFNVRGQLYFKPNSDVSFRLIGDYSKQQQHFSLTVPAGYFTTYANGATIANNIFVRAANNGYTLLPGDPFSRTGDADAPFQSNMESYGISGELKWDLGPATLTSITAYRWWDWDPKNDTDGTSLSINTKGQQQNRQRQFSQELRIASDGTHTVDYQAGLYYFWQVIRGYGQTGFGPYAATWNFNPVTTPAATLAAAQAALNGFETESFSDPSTRSYAAFGQVDWHVTDALTLTGGLRYTHENKDGEFWQRWVAGTPASDLSAAGIAIRNQFSPQLAFNGKVSDDSVSGLATISYKVSSEALVYATYSRGNKSGGLNLTSGGVAKPVVDPETVDNFEIGFKSQFLDRKLTWNGALYLTNVSNYQAAVSVPVGNTTAFIQYIDNIPKVRSKGFETDVSVAPSKWVSFTASASYTDAKYVRYTNAPQAPERLNISSVQDLSGVALPGIPKFAFSLGADDWQPIGQLNDGWGGGDLELYGHADYSHRSGYNTTNTNTIYGDIPGFGLLNARIGLRSSTGRWDFSAWARNLTNEQYFVTRSGGNFGLITAIVGDPRTYGVTLRTKW
jgi:iron complex outermembrane receptor protein